jgi:hypothetical protein
LAGCDSDLFYPENRDELLNEPHLTSQNLISGLRDVEPCGAIDLWVLLDFTGLIGTDGGN